jgi:hypothetical protein
MFSIFLGWGRPTRSVLATVSSQYPLSRETEAVLRSHTGFFALSVAILLLPAGCAKKQAAPQVVAPIPATVATVEQRDVSLYGDWVATLDGFVNAQIQPQVSPFLWFAS